MEADSVNVFRIQVDKYWTNQDAIFDYNFELAGILGLPICM